MRYRVVTNGKSFKLQSLTLVSGRASWGTTESWHDVPGMSFETKKEAIKERDNQNLPWTVVE